MKILTIENMAGTRSTMVNETMQGWIEEFHNAARLICDTYHQETPKVGYKVRSLVMEGLCTKLEGVLNDNSNDPSDEFIVYWNQENLDNIFKIELR